MEDALSAGPNAAHHSTVNHGRIAQNQQLPPQRQSELLVPESELAESSENDSALRWASTPRAFKSKQNMRAMRQKAMSTYLNTTESGDGKPIQADSHDSDGTTSVHRVQRRSAALIHNPTPPSPFQSSSSSRRNRSQPLISLNIPSTIYRSLSPADYLVEPSGGIPDTVSRPLSLAHQFVPLSPTANADEEHFRSQLDTNSFLGQGSLFQDYFTDQTILELERRRGMAQETKRREIEGPETWSAHMLTDSLSLISLQKDWRTVQSMLPEAWKWDLEYRTDRKALSRPWAATYGSWTCTPLEPGEPMNYPLSIAKAPLVLAVEHRWPPACGLTPPPDPRPAFPIDCRAGLSIDVVRDIFLTFQGSIGFYFLINGFLQIMVPGDFDTSWASSHLPHKYGGLKVCYIERTLEPTMLSSSTETSDAGPSSNLFDNTGRRSASPPTVHPPTRSSTKKTSLKLNDLIEARPLSAHRREKYAGRISLKVAREGSASVVMSTHIITEAILAKSLWEAFFSLWSNALFTRLENDWNDHAEIWAGGRKFGTIEKTFDEEPGSYPDGFPHDVTLIKPASPAVAEGLASPIPNMGWLNHNSWSSLRQQKSTVKFLADTEGSQSAKSIQCSRPSDVLVVGEGIFLNQKAAAGGSNSLREHDVSTWKDLVSRAILYRVYPDFDPPNGHSGTALYADGTREDGTQGPGIVGFQSFVQRSGHVQNFEMEGPALERRLQLGRVAFYGALEVPAELKKYDIV